MTDYELNVSVEVLPKAIIAGKSSKPRCGELVAVVGFYEPAEYKLPRVYPVAEYHAEQVYGPVRFALFLWERTFRGESEVAVVWLENLRRAAYKLKGAYLSGMYEGMSDPTADTTPDEANAQTG